MNIITDASIKAFEDFLCLDEKSAATVNKYVQAVRSLAAYLSGEVLTKRRFLEYREFLAANHQAQTVNGYLTAIHAYLTFRSWESMRIKSLKVQCPRFLNEDRELSKAEYQRLLTAAKGKNPRLYYLMMTLGSTGIRISELPYITVQAVKAGRANIRLKGKSRTILLPGSLCSRLMAYCRQQDIWAGPIFRTRTGRPVDRSNVWHALKELCKEAQVDARKVFPHNFRHLFARIFYSVEKNLAHLADILGHSRIETTRIYTAVSVSTHKRILNRLALVE